jgi:mannose-6-phosphate isomerase-like protein (cupin superfamily)
MDNPLETYYSETDEHQEYETDERCHIIELLNQPDDRSQSVARARVEPGVTTAWHRLKDTSECYYILSGRGVAQIGEDLEQEMQPHSIIRIPANTAQRISNVGDEDLVFLCFCVPAFSVENYESVE